VYKGALHGLFYTEREKLNTDLLDFITNQDFSHYRVEEKISEAIV